MIDPKSLRIGSRIFWKGKNEVVIEASDFAELEHDENYFDVGSPIPLTDEVLIRAGASVVKNHRGSYCSFNIDDKTYVAKNPDGFYLVIQRTDENEQEGDEEYYTELKVDYLHTLQNLIHCLTGTELEIKP